MFGDNTFDRLSSERVGYIRTAENTNLALLIMATEECLVPLGQATPRASKDRTGSRKGKRKKKKDKTLDHGKENSQGTHGGEDGSRQQEPELAPLKLMKSGRKWGHGTMSPGKSPGKSSGKHNLDLKGGLMGDSMNSKALLAKLPKVERGGFDVEAKLFQQVQKEYEQALAKKRNMFDIVDRAKHNAVRPLLAQTAFKPSAVKAEDAKATAGLPSLAGSDNSTLKLGMNSKMVLPSIPAASHCDQAACSSQDAGGEEVQVRTVQDLQAMLPEEFHELKQMMDLHRDLKAQMARNKEQITKLQGSGDDGEMIDLLRQQASHVVMMMKDVLDRMESYPEELWALYGAVEAYEKCYENMQILQSGGEVATVTSEELGPRTLEEHRDALVDIYSHVLEGVQTFLAVGSGGAQA